MKTCIQDVNIIDVTTEITINNGYVIFDDTGILEKGVGSPSLIADKFINGSGLTLLPGLIDCHVHLGMDCSSNPIQQIELDNQAQTAYKVYQHGEFFLQAGVTTVRNLGTKFNMDIEYHKAIAKGIVQGPRVFGSGMPIVMTGGHCHPLAIEADGLDEVRKATRSQIKAGVDLIKVMATGGVLTEGTDPGAPQLSEEELRCICTEAKQVNKTISAHTIGLEGVKNALRAGVTTIEHGYYLDDEAIDLMLQNNTYLCATLIAPMMIMWQPPEANIPAFIINKLNPLIDKHRISFKKALKAGVKIIAGTDAGTPYNLHGLLYKELELMIEEGMSNMEALKAATITPAEMMNLQHMLGSIDVGKQADFILIEGDPLQEISHLRHIRGVFKGGQCYVNPEQTLPVKV
jgi:imidazolonepropionase-like amidohydrolase